MPSLSPHLADEMMLDPRRIAFACDYHRNPSFARSDARTADWQGRTLAQVLRAGLVEETAVWLSRTVEALLSGRTVELDPVRLGIISKRDGGHREIWVMSYQRRSLSNLLAGVLTQVAAPQFHPHVRAYIPGARDVVTDSILDVAEAVHEQRVAYFIKEDLKSFFDVLPHALLASSVAHYGLSERMQRLVMNVIASPRWVGTPTSGGLVPATLGTPMGLPESSTLANMACFELDQHLADLGRRAVVLRYSDDIFVGSARRDDVVHAVRAIRGWCRKYAVALKDVHPMASARSRVRDVRNQRIPLLGAEIDRNGNVHIPRPALRTRLVELRRASEKLEDADEDAFSGRSVYAGGVGVLMLDQQDIFDRATAFADYWSKLNEREADNFRDQVNHSFSGLLQREPSQTVWVAALGTPRVAGQEDEPCDHQSNGKCASSESQSGAGGLRPQAKDEELKEFASTGQWNNDHRQASAGRWASYPGGNSSYASHTDEPTKIEVMVSHPHGTLGMRDEGHSPIVHPGMYVCSQVVEPPPNYRDNSLELGMGAGSGPPVPPRARSTGNDLEIRVSWRPDGVSSGSVVTVIDRALGYSEDTRHASVRPEFALVRALRALLRSARARRAQWLNVTVPAWLPKHLLSRQRRFRSAGMFAELLRLHREAEESGLQVTLVGCAE
jgi:hypothetical protein